MPMPKFPVDVPIVGQPFAILKWWQQALLRCNCQQEKGIINLMVLTGKDSPVKCEACGKAYAIQGIAPSPEGPQLIVGQVVTNGPPAHY